jgi:serine/threonine protein kinase
LLLKVKSKPRGDTVVLHLDYLTPGSQVTLPELEGSLNGIGSEFKVISVHPGGMGVCVRLQDTRTNSHVALKCIRPDLLGANENLERFYDELEVWVSASACSGVVEAGAVVRVNELPSIVSRWMNGGDLSTCISALRKEQKIGAVLRIVKTLAWVVEELGVIHRDLKPANILLDTDKLAYVADWGLARPTAAAIGEVLGREPKARIERADRTSVGTFLGTVTYAAPEQIQGLPSVDHRADIYALGCMMFELESGAPPFGGRDASEIAYHHIHTQPPRLGGVFKRTNLGLERVIARCLEKNPERRYPHYSALKDDIFSVAANLGLDKKYHRLKRRYPTVRLGKGREQLERMMHQAHSQDGRALLEFSDLEPILKEADNLIALGRYQEAVELLSPLYIPEFVECSGPWHVGNSFALSYAFCLQKIVGQSERAMTIYRQLEQSTNPPPEYFVNYALALLTFKRWDDASQICERGLQVFPKDIDLLGNYTIALQNAGRLQEAAENAAKRMSFRKDVHSIEELVGVLAAYRDQLRDANLPEAIDAAIRSVPWIEEGLSLNPNFGPLRMAAIDCLKFAGDRKRMLDACQALYAASSVPISYRQMAALEVAKEFSRKGHHKEAIELIDKHLQTEMDENISALFEVTNGGSTSIISCMAS